MPDLPVMTVDFESRSFKDIRKVGTWRYAEDETTEVMCLAYRRRDKPYAKIWAPPLPFPQEIIDHVEAGGAFEAHSVQMERSMWLHHLTTGNYQAMAGIKNAKPIPMPTRWIDSMASCAYRGLPLGLDKVGAALALPVQKDDRGKYLIKTLCSPKGPTKAEPDRVYREDYDLMEEMLGYCQTDVDSEHVLSETIGPLPPAEQRIWVLDQTINQRGVLLDVPAVLGALDVAERVLKEANKELEVLTGGEVTSGTQVPKLLKWIQSQGVRMPNVQADTVEYFIKTTDNADVKRALQIRQIAGKTSVSKLYSMAATFCTDHRVRGLLQYHGASTGRWSGRLVQPQNFPRGDKKLLKIMSQDEILELLKQPGDEPYLTMTMMFGERIIDAISTVLRGMMMAAEGKTFMFADFAAIEARVVMWLAGCDKALKAFEAYDNITGLDEDGKPIREGPDIYCVMAETLYGRPITKADEDERQLGKVTILGCGYGMGVDTFILQAEKDYGLVLERDMAERAVYGYRETYPEVKSLWYGLQTAAIKAVETGKACRYACVTYRLEHDAAGTWLTCELPNNRKLWYLDPIVETSMVVKPWEAKKAREEKREPKKVSQKDLSYMGRDNKNGGVWRRIRTYGGMLCENVVQAIARDFMVEGMIRVEAAGYPIVLTVHDEIGAEVVVGFGSLKHFESLMAGPTPDWGRGCPIAVEGWQGPRFKK